MEIYYKELDENLAGLLAHLKESLRGIRSNQPSIELLEELKANYYDQLVPLKQLGSLSLGSQREVQVNVWDKNAVGPITGAIQDAKLGFSVQSDGNIVRAFLPALSNERREELSKLVKKTVEEARVQVRSRRDEINKKVKLAEDQGELSEDQSFAVKKGIQERIDKCNKEIETLLANKIKELES